MTVLVFPGSSLHNEKLIEQAKQHYDDVIGIRWNHWDAEEDREDDYRRVVKLLQSSPTARVFAKSYGGALVMRALSEYLVAADITILGALPQVFDELDVERVDQAVSIIQNEFDPHGSYEAVASVFSDVTCVRGNKTHDYSIPADS